MLNPIQKPSQFPNFLHHLWKVWTIVVPRIDIVMPDNKGDTYKCGAESRLVNITYFSAFRDDPCLVREYVRTSILRVPVFRRSTSPGWWFELWGGGRLEGGEQDIPKVRWWFGTTLPGCFRGGRRYEISDTPGVDGERLGESEGQKMGKSRKIKA